MESYIEFKIGVGTTSEWYDELKELMEENGISVRWQGGFFHMTAAFINNTKDSEAVVRKVSEALKDHGAFKIKLNKLDAFTTGSGRENIIHLGSTAPIEELLKTVEMIRNAVTSAGEKMQAGFIPHVTLGRAATDFKAKDKGLGELRELLKEVDLGAMDVTVRDVSYIRRSDHKELQKWTLN